MPEPEQNRDQHQHKGVQCDLTDITAEIAMVISTEQPLVGVEDIPSDNSCSNDLLHPSINRVSDSPNTNLFAGWTQEQMSNAQESDSDIGPVKKWMDEGEAGHHMQT